MKLPIKNVFLNFQEQYFELMKNALKPNGIVCSQGSSHWLDIEHVRATIQGCKRQFKNVGYAVASVPSYPCGQIGFIIGCLDQVILMINL